jgi:hypothetical protein
MKRLLSAAWRTLITKCWWRNVEQRGRRSDDQMRTQGLAKERLHKTESDIARSMAVFNALAPALGGPKQNKVYIILIDCLIALPVCA